MIESTEADVMNMLMNAAKGDVKQIRKYYLKGHDMNATDYDQRSALHIGKICPTFSVKILVALGNVSHRSNKNA